MRNLPGIICVILSVSVLGGCGGLFVPDTVAIPQKPLQTILVVDKKIYQVAKCDRRAKSEKMEEPRGFLFLDYTFFAIATYIGIIIPQLLTFNRYRFEIS